MRHKYMIIGKGDQLLYGQKRFIAPLVDDWGNLYDIILCHNLNDLRGWLKWYERRHWYSEFVNVGRYSKEFFW